MSVAANHRQRGIVYTFYSFKGGVGRTMAMAIVAALLAKWGRSVLVVDWDLEAPGIERFFIGDNSEAARLRASKPGVVDLILAHASGEKLDWRECLLEFRPGEKSPPSSPVSIITAGRGGEDYVGRMQSLDFEKLFAERGLGSYIEELRDEWISQFEFVLIDSRTGVTDIGGICTVHLADVLVPLLTTTDSSVEGTLEIVERARKAQERLPLDRRRLLAVPVPSRDESRTEYEKAAQWKSVFAERFRDLYSDWLPTGIKSQDAVDILRIPYVPYWSFGERLPVIEEGTSDPASLGYAYEVLARLIEARLDWYEALEGHTLLPPPIRTPRSVDSQWLERHRLIAIQALAKFGREGFMEVNHICLNASVERSQTELLAAAKQSAVPTFGWPIGLVLENREESRPRPTNEGIVARVDGGTTFDYWTLAKNGDFYTLRSLFEDERAEMAVFFNTRIVQVTEALLYAVDLYKSLGVELNASIGITIRHGGLRGRELTATTNRVWWQPTKNLYEDEVSATVTFKLGTFEGNAVDLVKRLCEPLFVLFDFAEIRDETYQQIVTDFINGKAT